jgi:hypothetical protein
MYLFANKWLGLIGGLQILLIKKIRTDVKRIETSLASHYPKRRQRKQKKHKNTLHCPAGTARKEKFISPDLKLYKSPNFNHSFSTPWVRFVQNLSFKY